MNFNVKRESLKFPNEEIEGCPVEEWTYLSVYDKRGNLLVRSSANHFENEIRLEFEGVIFVSPPNKDGEILLDYNSLIQKFKD